MSEQEALRAALGKDMLARATADPRQEFGSFFLSRLLGFIVSYEGERCIVSFEAIPTLFNPQGTLHGGILATAMDVSMGHLLRHVDRRRHAGNEGAVPGARDVRAGSLRGQLPAQGQEPVVPAVARLPRGRRIGGARDGHLEVAAASAGID
jgi:hypothetical protein